VATVDELLAEASEVLDVADVDARAAKLFVLAGRLQATGDERATAEARVLLAKAARDGSALAAFDLAMLLLAGRGGDVDTAGGLEWLGRAAVELPAAATVLGGLLLFDPARAVDGVAWLRRAAAAGEPSAFWLLGVAPRRGLGVAADAAQARGDVFVSMGVIAGLALGRFGFAWIDPVVALAVAGAIGFSAWRVFQDVMPVLTDRIVFDPEEVARIVTQVPGVVSVHDIRSRGPRRDAFVQMHLVVDADDVAGAHAITDAVEDALARELGVKEAFIHVEPEDDNSGPPGTRPSGLDKGYQA